LKIAKGEAPQAPAEASQVSAEEPQAPAEALQRQSFTNAQRAQMVQAGIEALIDAEERHEAEPDTLAKVPQPHGWGATEACKPLRARWLKWKKETLAQQITLPSKVEVKRFLLHLYTSNHNANEVNDKTKLLAQSTMQGYHSVLEHAVFPQMFRERFQHWAETLKMVNSWYEQGGQAQAAEQTTQPATVTAEMRKGTKSSAANHASIFERCQVQDIQLNRPDLRNLSIVLSAIYSKGANGYQ
jgi:hypothetical protein